MRRHSSRICTKDTRRRQRGSLPGNLAREGRELWWQLVLTVLRKLELQAPHLGGHAETNARYVCLAEVVPVTEAPLRQPRVQLVPMLEIRRGGEMSTLHGPQRGSVGWLEGGGG